jgi:hypothetical protein
MHDQTSSNNEADFLFVHYEDDNPLNRSNSLSRQKAVFAQKAHYRKKRLAAVERLKPSTISFCQQLPFVYNVVPVESSGLSSQEKKREDVDSISDAARAGRIAPHRVSLRARQMKDLWSPLSHLGQGFIDPFSATAVPMSEFMNLYWHHCTWTLRLPESYGKQPNIGKVRHFILPLAYPLNSSPMGAWWWQQGQSEPVIHLTLLMSSASHKLAMNTINNTPSRELQRSKREFLRLQGNIIKRLNHLLQHPDAIPESIIHTIAALRAIEVCNAVPQLSAHVIS